MCDQFHMPIKASASNHDNASSVSGSNMKNNHDYCLSGSDTNTPGVADPTPVTTRSGHMVKGYKDY